MCLSDWRAGRLVRAVINTDVCQAGNAQYAINANQQRVGLSIIYTGDSQIGGGVTPITIDSIHLFSGIVIMAKLDGYNPSIHWTLSTHGDLPCRSFTIDPNSLVDPVTVIEYIASEAMLTAALKEFERTYK